jgi:deoxyribodipyrimidine photo-lyase
MTTILWFSLDLRLADNPALAAAVARNQPNVPLFILDDEDAGVWAPGSASRWWLHGSLAAIGDDLARLGSQLVQRRGKAEAVLDGLLRETGATALDWNRGYEP